MKRIIFILLCIAIFGGVKAVSACDPTPTPDPATETPMVSDPIETQVIEPSPTAIDTPVPSAVPTFSRPKPTAISSILILPETGKKKISAGWLLFTVAVAIIVLRIIVSAFDTADK